nr:MAG TPA: hypothetical protein [Caudoviricetes sp.]
MNSYFNLIPIPAFVGTVFLNYFQFHSVFSYLISVALIRELFLSKLLYGSNFLRSKFTSNISINLLRYVVVFAIHDDIKGNRRNVGFRCKECLTVLILTGTYIAIPINLYIHLLSLLDRFSSPTVITVRKSFRTTETPELLALLNANEVVQSL